jgi:hypothetical protein
MENVIGRSLNDKLTDDEERANDDRFGTCG